MSHGYFITGTDTDVGKTRVALGLLQALRNKGYSTLAMKPVACGCTEINGELRNDDAVQLMTHTTGSLPYDDVNPYAFAAPIAPHLAAAASGKRIDIDLIRQHIIRHRNMADYLIVEGAGGWMVPLNESETTADMVKLLELPVILVVGIRLGCLNHALLTISAINQYDIPLAGWVANRIDRSCLLGDENISALRERIHAPLLGIIPYMERADIQAVADCLDITHIDGEI